MYLFDLVDEMPVRIEIERAKIIRVVDGSMRSSCSIKFRWSMVDGVFEVIVLGLRKSTKPIWPKYKVKYKICPYVFLCIQCTGYL